MELDQQEDNSKYCIELLYLFSDNSGKGYIGIGRNPEQAEDNVKRTLMHNGKLASAPELELEPVVLVNYAREILKRNPDILKYRR